MQLLNATLEQRAYRTQPAQLEECQPGVAGLFLFRTATISARAPPRHRRVSRRPCWRTAGRSAGRVTVMLIANEPPGAQQMAKLSSIDDLLLFSSAELCEIAQKSKISGLAHLLPGRLLRDWAALREGPCRSLDILDR